MTQMTLYRNSKKQAKSYAYYNIKCVISSLTDLQDAVLFDHVSCAYKDNHRSKEDFISADCVMMDLDNTHSDDPDDWKNIDDVVEAFPDVEFYYIESRNHMKAKKNEKKKIDCVLVDECQFLTKNHVLESFSFPFSSIL